MKKLLMSAMMMAVSIGAMNAQTSQKQIVEEGGTGPTGPYKSEVVGDASCPAFTIYRPQNLNDLVAKQGALPVIVYANGACFNNNVEMRLLLSEVASYGYVIAAIGPYDEEDVMAQWRGVLKSAYPETKRLARSSRPSSVSWLQRTPRRTKRSSRLLKYQHSRLIQRCCLRC